MNKCVCMYMHVCMHVYASVCVVHVCACMRVCVYLSIRSFSSESTHPRIVRITKRY